MDRPQLTDGLPAERAIAMACKPGVNACHVEAMLTGKLLDMFPFFVVTQADNTGCVTILCFELVRCLLVSSMPSPAKVASAWGSLTAIRGTAIAV